ncbi:hypothetical protein niasHT_014947 [Heterodera trifolii]|uniref:Uncharacterized protein n=1 Tax=Heterodera trifolii TaxID=157864 RepID=A0ABD2LFS2_9BILA
MQPTSSKLSTTEGKRGFFSVPTELKKPTVSQPFHIRLLLMETVGLSNRNAVDRIRRLPQPSMAPQKVELLNIDECRKKEQTIQDSAQHFADENSLPIGLQHCARILKRKGFSQKAAVEGAKAIGVLAEHKILVNETNFFGIKI